MEQEHTIESALENRESDVEQIETQRDDIERRQAELDRALAALEKDEDLLQGLKKTEANLEADKETLEIKRSDAVQQLELLEAELDKLAETSDQSQAILDMLEASGEDVAEGDSILQNRRTWLEECRRRIAELAERLGERYDAMGKLSSSEQSLGEKRENFIKETLVPSFYPQRTEDGVFAVDDLDTNTDSNDTNKMPFEKLSEYINQHNYGKDDYPEYSQDPEWQRLHRETYPNLYNVDSSDQLDITGQNFNPQKDTLDAFRYADATCDRASPQWQEVANRHLDNLTQEMDKVNDKLPAAREKLKNKKQVLSDYVNKNRLTAEMIAYDPDYQKLSKEYSDAKSILDELNSKQRLYADQINDIISNINPDLRTSFRGMNGVDFNNSYNDFITERQGCANPSFGGDCGINETCSIVNQQTGSNLDELDGIKEYIARRLCVTGVSPDKNGGTNALGRSAFLISKGLTFDRVEGARDTGMDLSLDDIAQRFNAGESAGMMVKAEDLSQPELASRKFDFKKSISDNQGRFNANHATTIAGFSYKADGKVAGVWLNDTGKWAGSNRVYIDVAKFQKMQRQTKGFAIEFSRKK